MPAPTNPLLHPEDGDGAKRNTLEYEVGLVGEGALKISGKVTPAGRTQSNDRKGSPRQQSTPRGQPSPSRATSAKHRAETPKGYTIVSERGPEFSRSNKGSVSANLDDQEMNHFQDGNQQPRPMTAPESGESLGRQVQALHMLSKAGIIIDDGSSQRLPAPSANTVANRSAAPLRSVSPSVAVSLAATASNITNGILIDDSSVGKPRAMSARNHRSPAMILNNMPSTAAGSEGPHSARQAPTVPLQKQVGLKSSQRSASAADLGQLLQQNEAILNSNQAFAPELEGDAPPNEQPSDLIGFRAGPSSVVAGPTTDRRRSPSTILREGGADLQPLAEPAPASRPLQDAHVNNNPFTSNNYPSSSRHPAHEATPVTQQTAAGGASKPRNVEDQLGGSGNQQPGGDGSDDGNKQGNANGGVVNEAHGQQLPDGAAANGGGTQHNTRITIGMMIRKWIVLSRIGAGSFGETFCAAEMPEGFNMEEYHRLVEQVKRQYTNGATGTHPGLTNTTNTGSIGSRGAAEDDEEDNSSRKRSGGGVVGASGYIGPAGGDFAGMDAPLKMGHDGFSTNEDETTEAKSSATARRICLDVLALLPQNMKPLREVCIKVEQDCKNVLRLEVQSIRKCQECPQVVRIINSGHIDQPLSVNYLVMERLGPNLADLRRACPNNTFDVYTSLKVGISCLKVIRSIHDLGLTHRDIKPSNFVVGLGPVRSKICYLIDFGLARRFRRSNGQIRPARENTGFRGTNRYASIQSHRHCELGRVDDLWSLLFMLVEMVTGALPWRKYKDKEQIGDCKIATVNETLVQEMPREFTAFLQHLQSLTYESDPNYDFLIQLLEAAIVRRNYHEDRPLGWERSASHMLELDASDDGRTTRPIPLPMVIRPVTTLQMQAASARRPTTTTTTSAAGAAPASAPVVGDQSKIISLAQPVAITSPDLPARGARSLISGSLQPLGPDEGYGHDEADRNQPMILSSAPILGSESAMNIKAMRASSASISNIPVPQVTVGGTVASPPDPNASPSQGMILEPAQPFEIEDDIQGEGEVFGNALKMASDTVSAEKAITKPPSSHARTHSSGAVESHGAAIAPSDAFGANNPFSRQQQPNPKATANLDAHDASLANNAQHNDSGGSGNGVRDYSSPEPAAKEDEMLSNTQIENATNTDKHFLPMVATATSRNNTGAIEPSGQITQHRSPLPGDSGSSAVEVFAPPHQSPDPSSHDDHEGPPTNSNQTAADPNTKSGDETNNNKQPNNEKRPRRERRASQDDLTRGGGCCNGCTVM